MKEPIVVKKCLHRFCKVCFNSAVNHENGKFVNKTTNFMKNCPMCKSKISNKRLIVKDKTLNDMIRLFLDKNSDIDHFNNMEFSFRENYIKTEFNIQKFAKNMKK